MEAKTATVIGLGMIGGSLAKALRRTSCIKAVIGIDTCRETLDTALFEGVLDRAYTDIDVHITDSDIVFVCTPIDRIPELVEKVSKKVKQNCVITDTGSIKGSLISRVENIPGDFTFIGGHPMCGSEKSGYEASKGHLFENAYYILTPCAKTVKPALDLMEKIIIEIGGIPVIIEDEEHDIITGAISHVPHVISAALVNLVSQLDCSKGYMKKLAAGGFKDITRISSSSPDMWQNIVLNNKYHVKNILNKFVGQVEQLLGWLDGGKQEEILDFFKSAKEYRDRFTTKNVGLITPFYDISVDIEDKPGEIGKLATLLGGNHINIKNINVANSREYGQGCLIVTFSDSKSVDEACDVLNQNGYTVYRM